MDDWLSFTEAHCLTLLRDLPWRSEDLTTQDIFEKMWSLLRRAVLYFLKYVDGQHTDDRGGGGICCSIHPSSSTRPECAGSP